MFFSGVAWYVQSKIRSCQTLSFFVKGGRSLNWLCSLLLYQSMGTLLCKVCYVSTGWLNWVVNLGCSLMFHVHPEFCFHFLRDFLNRAINNLFGYTKNTVASFLCFYIKLLSRDLTGYIFCRYKYLKYKMYWFSSRMCLQNSRKYFCFTILL